MSFQEYDYWGSRGGPLIFSIQRQKVHILGASSLSPVIEKNWLQLQAKPEENNNSNLWSFVQSEQQKRPQGYSHLAVKSKIVKDFQERNFYDLARRCQQFPLQIPFKLRHPIDAKAATANPFTLQALHISNCVLQTLRNSWRVSKSFSSWLLRFNYLGRCLGPEKSLQVSKLCSPDFLVTPEI